MLNQHTEISCISIHWQETIWKRKTKTKLLCRITVAAFYSECEHKLYLGHARCHEKDNFCKDTGSTIALSRAIANAEKVIECSREEVVKYTKQFASELEEYYINRMH